MQVAALLGMAGHQVLAKHQGLVGMLEVGHEPRCFVVAGRRSGDFGPVVEELGLPQSLDSQVPQDPPCWQCWVGS